MLFNSISFVLFFIALLSVLRFVPRAGRPGVLLAASLLFYTMWVPAYLLLLLVEIGVNFALLRAIAYGRFPRAALVTALAFSLGLLAYFKYAAFLLASLMPLLSGALDEPFGLPDIFLPLGISFFTFQMLGLSIDAYRRKFDRPPGLRDYALFVCFFPQLIAGPILRGDEFFPQIDTPAHLSRERIRSALWLIAGGMLKKIVLADFLLAPYADEVFLDPSGLGAAATWTAMYSFAFQIYYDFSGYTDIARGLARLLGFEIPENFREPYLARNPVEFWRRWHITLSEWLRDYLYISLGGNRRGTTRTQLNLFLTMLIGGLWHGAAWNFVLWGALHGLLLVVHRLVFGRGSGDRPLAWRDAPQILAFFHIVCVLWIFFRAEDLATVAAFAQEMVKLGGNVPWLQIAALLVCAGAHIAEHWIKRRTHAEATHPAVHIADGLAWGAIAGLSLALGGAAGSFIYFQF